MYGVLFVDDEPNVLNGLRRMLRPYKKEMDMEFASGGHVALSHLKAKPFDIVVSDMRMPEMDGVELLKQVKEQFPNVIRFALSGYAETQMQLESARVVHQFIAKPADAENLKESLDRAIALRSVLSGDQLRLAITGIGSLPSLPSLYNQILEEAASPEGTMSSIGKIIAKDIGMSAKVLQLVNSAFFGLSRHVATTEEAAAILGIDVIKSLVLSIKVFSSFEDTNLCGLDLEKLITHGQVTGFVARKLGKEMGLSNKQCDHALMAGMLHDVGQLIMAHGMPEGFKEAQSQLKVSQDNPLDVEANIFGATHAEIGAYLLGVWALPSPVVEAIAFHHRPEKCLDNKVSVITAVHVSNAFVEKLLDHSAGAGNDGLSREYMEKIASEDDIEKWSELAQQLIQEN